MVNRVVMFCLVPQLNRKTLVGEGQRTRVLEGNDILYDGCNAIVAAKRQRNILRDYFMNEGQVPDPMDSS